MSLAIKDLFSETAEKVSSPKNFGNTFSVANLTDIFQKQIRHKQTKGLDKVTPWLFAKDLDANISKISRKCLNGNYHFVKYLERLLLKRRNVPPRVLCIPTVRDKIVLKALNEILKQAFANDLLIEVPNKKIRLIKEAIHTGKYDSFLKIDIKNFYDCINHKILFRQLKKKIKHKPSFELLRRALNNAVVPNHYSRQEIIKQNEQGVHQGLPISNTLAEIYLTSFDGHIRRLKDVAYFRYVDDILILTQRKRLKAVEKSVCHRLEKLFLSPNDKHDRGSLEKGFDYIGYTIRRQKFTVRDSSKQKFLNSIFKEFIRFKYNKKKYNETILIRRLNLRITGAISEKKRYGWIAFFQEIDDIPKLYAMDKLIQATAKRFYVSDDGIAKLKKLVRSYHEMKNSPRGGYIFNFDASDMRKTLVEFGDVPSDAELTDDEWKAKFERFKTKMLGSLEEDVGQFS